MSQPQTVADQPTITPASAARFTELVRKIATSPACAFRKRKATARKTLSRVIKEQQRYAKTAKLRAVGLTLTFRGNADFSPKHISAFMDRLRRVLKRAGHILPYTWVLERAKQLHYHVMLWLPRSFVLDPAILAKWWLCGSTWIKGCHSAAAWGRYITKCDNIAKLPKGTRMFGYGGLDDAGQTIVARAALPRWLLILLPPGRRARRCPGGWADIVSGDVYRSPYTWTPWGAVLKSIISSRSNAHHG